MLLSSPAWCVSHLCSSYACGHILSPPIPFQHASLSLFKKAFVHGMVVILALVGRRQWRLGRGWAEACIGRHLGEIRGGENIPYMLYIKASTLVEVTERRDGMGRWGWRKRSMPLSLSPSVSYLLYTPGGRPVSLRKAWQRHRYTNLSI